MISNVLDHLSAQDCVKGSVRQGNGGSSQRTSTRFSLDWIASQPTYSETRLEKIFSVRFIAASMSSKSTVSKF